MYNRDYYDRISYNELFYEFMEDKMKEQRKEIMQRLTSIVLPNYVEDFAKILCAALENKCDYAEKLWIEFGFCASDFCAIMEDKKGYFENYKEDESWVVDYE